MRFVLILAFVASLALHLLVLLGPGIELPGEVPPAPLMAELKPMPTPPPLQRKAPLKPARPIKPRAATRQVEPQTGALPVLGLPGPLPSSMPGSGAAAAPQSVSAATEAPSPVVSPAVEPASAEPVVARLPPHGIIRYRVDRGDSNFEIGFARQEWFVADGHYRLSSVAETTGLVWLFKAYRVEMESRGVINAAGLQPQTFAIRRNGLPTKETAEFDWSAMTVRVADHPEQPLDEGAQDFLSFNYQLGYLAHSEAGNALPIATGKKYEIYNLEALGDETIDLPAGSMRTLHLRVPGTNPTELWLAYDYLLLPVKIRYVDAKGDSFVQVATQIQVGDELDQKRDDARPR